MDKSKHPAISIQSVHLLECVARVGNPEAELSYNLALTQFSREVNDKGLIAIAGFDLMYGIDKPPCALTCAFGAVYTQDDPPNMSWEEFTDGMIVSHIMPFVREFVSSVTLRMPMGALNLSPSNTNLLVQEFKAREAAKSQQTAKA